MEEVPAGEREMNEEEEQYDTIKFKFIYFLFSVEEQVMDGREVDNGEEPNNLHEDDQQPPIPRDILQSPVADTGTPDE